MMIVVKFAKGDASPFALPPYWAKKSPPPKGVDAVAGA